MNAFRAVVDLSDHGPRGVERLHRRGCLAASIRRNSSRVKNRTVGARLSLTSTIASVWKIVDPHRAGIVLEEQPVARFRFAPAHRGRVCSLRRGDLLPVVAAGGSARRTRRGAPAIAMMIATAGAPGDSHVPGLRQHDAGLRRERIAPRRRSGESSTRVPGCAGPRVGRVG